MLLSIIFPIILTLVGMIMLVKLRFFFIIHPIKTVKEFIDEFQKRPVRRSFFLALAGTLGVGNIFGVAAGIMIGGPGTLFWLFISSFFSMIIKYSETLLVFDVAEEGQGMWGVFTDAFAKAGKTMSFLYALFTVTLALFMGSAIQSSALSDLAKNSIGNVWFIAPILLMIFFIPCLVGKADKVDRITEYVIPMTTIIYIIMCFVVIIINLHKISSVFLKIVTSAFLPRSFISGVGILAIKEGFARGILSNEAGVGTSTLAHSGARDRTPHVAGLFAMGEVFFDTTLLCMLTGFAILLSVNDVFSYKTPMSLVFAAFVNSLGNFSGFILIFCIFCFAYATIICWYFYGIKSISVCFTKLRWIFSILFLLFVAFSGWIDERFLLSITDVLLFLMALMTLSAIIKKRSRICLVSKNKEQK